MAISLNEVKKGDYVVISGEPYEILDKEHVAMQQRRAVVKMKVRNLKNGKVKEESMLSQASIEEAEVEKTPAVFAYQKRDEFWFHEKGKPQNRFMVKADALGESVKFLKPKMEVWNLMFEDEIININLPIKAEYEVIEAPPVIKGATASGGNKPVKIDTGAMVSAPMFIEVGDKIIVNIERGGEYVSKAGKQEE